MAKDMLFSSAMVVMLIWQLNRFRAYYLTLLILDGERYWALLGLHAFIPLCWAHAVLDVIKDATQTYELMHQVLNECHSEGRKDVYLSPHCSDP